jgi:heme o synthase
MLSQTVATELPMSTHARDYFQLTKPGITRMVLLTTGVGFYIASLADVNWLRLVHTLIGTFLAASGTNALNQYWERDLDGRMARTRNRPLPAGRMEARDALVFALATTLVGTAYLALTVNRITAAVVIASTISYVLIYTPLKRYTTLATIVGAVPGALPILAGWTAARGQLGPEGWALFWILFLWQMPHFLALAWMFREDYRSGGFAMLSVFDPSGGGTGRQALVYALALLPVSLMPTLLGITGATYFFGALVLGIGFTALGAALALRRTERRARRLFLASVLYLPALLLLMVIDKT